MSNLLRTSTVALVGSLALLSACRGGPSEDAPIVPIRNMYQQDRYDGQGRSEFFPDHRMMRPAVEGTVAREMESDTSIASGRLPDDSGYLMEVPAIVTARKGGAEALLHRGQERYNIYCTPCHSSTGDGRGIIISRGMLAPPTYHQDRIRHMPDGQLFATITNGIRNMPGYYAQIPVDDRWAIVSYVRALQVSQAGVAQQEAHQ